MEARPLNKAERRNRRRWLSRFLGYEEELKWESFGFYRRDHRVDEVIIIMNFKFYGTLCFKSTERSSIYVGPTWITDTTQKSTLEQGYTRICIYMKHRVSSEIEIKKTEGVKIFIPEQTGIGMRIKLSCSSSRYQI